MSNRRKAKNNRLRLKKNPGILERGMAKLIGPDRPHIPTHDEIFSHGEAEMDRYDMTGRVEIPEDTVEVIKVVPAMHKGVEVGEAIIHDDGSVGIKFHKDAPQWAIDEIHQVAGEVGYSLEEGRPDGST